MLEYNPALSRLRASIKFAHGNRVALRVQLAVPVALDQLPPLMRTCTILRPLAGKPGSFAVPETIIGKDETLCPLVGLEMRTVGGVMSMLTVSVITVEVEMFPVAS